MNDRTAPIKLEVTQVLYAADLPVCDTAYALNPDFTPNYNVLVVELTESAGYQVRLTGAMIALATVPYLPSTAQVDRAAKKALRMLMVGMRAQADAWLRDNPEGEGVS
jgi:hypothetical protein